MKYVIITILTSLTLMLSAQETFNIDEQTSYIDGSFTGSIVLDMKAKKDDAKKAWNDYIQDNHNVDIKGFGFFQKKDELTTDPISMTFLSDEKLILNTHFDGKAEKSKMTIFVTRPDGSSLYPAKDSMILDNLETLTEEFIGGFLPDYYLERVEKMQDNYDDAMNDLSDINNDISDKSSEIKKLQDEISILKKERIDATDKTATLRNTLEKRKRVYEKVKMKVTDL